MPNLSPQQALQRDADDVKARAARWRDAHRINGAVYAEVCDMLNAGRSPQAIMTALVDLAFTKRGDLLPPDPVSTLRGTVDNQEQRIIWWVHERTLTEQTAR